MTILKDARLRAGLSQEALAQASGTTQPQIRRLENGERKLTKEWAERLAPHLDMAAAGLIFADANLLPTIEASVVKGSMTPRADPDFLGARDFPIYSAVEGGRGEMVVENVPIEVVPRPWYMRDVRDGFGIVVTGESMSPKYEPGDIIIVNPRLPLIRGKPAVFASEKNGGDFTATVKRFDRQTEQYWHVGQLKPGKEFTLDKEIWRKAFRVVGTYEGI